MTRVNATRPAPTGASTDAQLVVVSGPARGRRHRLHDAVVLGRGEEVDVFIDDPEVSRRHARVAPSSSGLIVEDLGSRNGTTVEGRRIEAPTPAGFGDTVGLGLHTRLVIEKLDAHAEEQRRARRFETLGRLSASVARDLSNKLCAAMASLDFLRSLAADVRLGDEDARGCLTDLVSSVSESLELLPHLELDEGPPSRDRLADVSRITSDLSLFLARSFGPSITVASRVEPKLAVKGDSVELYHALLELSMRCREAMPEGGRLFIGARKRPLSRFDRRRGRVVITIRAGEPRDDSVEDTAPTSRDEPSWLRSVREVISLHGGRLSVEEATTGDAYQIQLPPSEPARMREITQPSLPRAEASGAASRGPVMIVHRDQVVRRSIGRVLASVGIGVQQERPEYLMEALRHADVRPRVVLVEDVPSMEGGSLVDEVAAFGRGVRLIVMAGRGPAPKPSAQRLILPEPWSAESVLASVERLLERSPGPAGGSEEP